MQTFTPFQNERCATADSSPIVFFVFIKLDLPERDALFE